MAVPSPGSVIRYGYLWAGESASGREEGKDRPALVLGLVVHSEVGETEILVVPVTHSAPQSPDDGVLFPLEEKQRLGLDDIPSWIITTEGNAFIWPGPDIRPVPGLSPGQLVYGRISDSLLRRVARSYLTNRQCGSGRLIGRTS